MFSVVSKDELMQRCAKAGPDKAIELAHAAGMAEAAARFEPLLAALRDTSALLPNSVKAQLSEIAAQGNGKERNGPN